MSWWALAAEYALKEEDKEKGANALTVGAPATFNSAGWTVNFGKKPLDVNALPPWVMGAAIVVAGVVAIAAVKVLAK